MSKTYQIKSTKGTKVTKKVMKLSKDCKILQETLSQIDFDVILLVNILQIYCSNHTFYLIYCILNYLPPVTNIYSRLATLINNVKGIKADKL